MLEKKFEKREDKILLKWRSKSNEGHDNDYGSVLECEGLGMEKICP